MVWVVCKEDPCRDFTLVLFSVWSLAFALLGGVVGCGMDKKLDFPGCDCNAVLELRWCRGHRLARWQNCEMS